ncbi:MAG: carboxypeptidase-like regulatory domain-containing protein [Thermoguttaceae bacterium]
MLTLSLVVLTSAVAQLTMAANPTTAPIAIDVALRDGGVLVGRVVNADGVGQPGAPVSIRYEDKVLASAKAGPEGYFAFKGLHGGVYQITTTDGHGIYRVWSPGSAPPAAQPVAALIEGDYVVRGQAEGGPCDPHPVMNFLQSPVGVAVVAGAVATAVSLPIALTVKPAAPSSP